MDKQKLEAEVISAIKQMVDNVRNEQNPAKASNVQIAKTDCIGDFGIESLELIALTEVLERQFNLGYIEVSSLNQMTVEDLCKKVVNHNAHIEVKKELLKLLKEFDPHKDYSSSYEEERIFWDWGLDSMAVEDLTCEIEHRFDVDLSGCNLSDYTFGEVIDCIAERV
jgi:acyl carrier protein